MNKIYKSFYQQRVFTLKEAFELTKNYQVAKNEIQRLKHKGLIKRILPGIYHIVPMDYTLYAPEPLLIASKLEKKSFFSLFSALHIHDLAESKEIFISCRKNKKLRIYSTTYNLVRTKRFFGVEEKIIGNQKAKVSDIERTFIDCLDNIELFESLEEFARIMGNTKLNTKKLFEYLKRYGKKKLCNYAGYFLEKLKGFMGIQDKELEKLQKLLGKKVYYLQIRPKTRYSKIRERFAGAKHRYVKQWKLVVVE